MSQFNREELAWAAGLFDGEGTIGLRRNGPGGRPRRIAAAVGMTERQAVDRFNRAIGVGTMTYDRQSNPNYPNAKRIHVWRAQNFEHVQHLVGLLWNWLSPHKRLQATSVLNTWRFERRRRRHEIGCSVLGCSLPHSSKGFCGMHYQRDRRGVA